MRTKPEQLTRRYLFALGALALLVILAYTTAQTLVWSRQVTASFVNVSGRQRTLTQRIGLLSLQYATSDDLEARLDLNDELVNTLRVYEASHLSLRDGGIAPGFEASAPVFLPAVTTPALRAYYNEEPVQLNTQVAAFREAVERLLAEDPASLGQDNPHLQEILTISSGPLLNAQDGLVVLYQDEAETAVLRFQQYETILLVVLLTTLLLIGLFVFRPSTAQIRAQTEALREANESLRRQNALSLSQAQDMKLAAEVGRSVTELQDLDQLLKNAVELIRSRFQLYYVQLYLVHSETQQLALKAGTGDVGEQLVRSGFMLPLALNSLNGIAAVEKRYLIVNDVSNSALFRPNRRLPHTRSEMVLPLMHHGRVIGVLDLQSSEVDTFSTDRLSIFQTIAAQLAAAIQNSRLFEALGDRAEAGNTPQSERIQAGWDRFLNGLDQPLSLVVSSEMGGRNGRTALPPSQRATKSVPLEVVGAKIGEVSLHLEEDEYLSEEQFEMVRKVAEMASRRLENLRLLAQAQKYRREAEFATRRLMGEVWSNYTSEQDRLRYAFDLNQVVNDAETMTETDNEGVVKSFDVRGAPIGHVALLEKEQLSEQEEALLNAVTEQISSHIENLRLTEQTEKALRETELYSKRLASLNELSAEIAALESIETISQIVARRTLEIVNAERVSITLVSPDEPEQLTIVAQVGVAGDASAQQQIELTGSPMADSIKTGTMSDGAFHAGEQVYQARFFPLFAEGRILGTLNVASGDTGLFTQRNEQLIRQIASLTSATLESAILSDRTQYALYESNTLFELVANLNEATTLGQILDTLVDSPISGGYYRATYSQIVSDENNSPKWLTVKEVRGEESATDDMGIPFNQPVDASQDQLTDLWINEPDGILIFENIDADERLLPDTAVQLKQAGYGALLVIPLHIRGSWLGLVQIGWQEPHRFSDRDRRLLAIVSEQASVVANQLRLLEETQQRADSLAKITQLEVQLSQATLEEDFISVLETVTDKASDLLLSYFDVSLDEETYTLEDVVHWHNGHFRATDGRRVDLTATHPIYNEWQTDSAQVILVPDVAHDGRLDDEARTYYLQNNVRSMVLLPLYSLGQWQGSISLWWNQPRQFSEEEVFIWSQVLDPLAASVASKRLLNDTELLYRIGSELNEAQQFTDVLKVLRSNTRAGRAADLLHVFYFDRPWSSSSKPTQIDFVGSLEKGEVTQSPIQKLPISALPALLVEQRDEVHAIEHVKTTSLLDEASRQMMLETFKARAAIFIPIIVGGNWLGGVGLYYRKPQEFTQNDIQRLRPLGEQISVVMQGIRFLRQAEVRAAREQQLREIATRVRSSTNVETIMRTAVRELGKAMGRQSVVYLETERDEVPEEKEPHADGEV